MKYVLLFLLMMLATAANSFGAYAVQSRLSEVKYVQWDDLAGGSTNVLGSTTSISTTPFVVPTANPNIDYQASALTTAGATYRGYTSAWGGTGPPFGSNHYGAYYVSTFQFVFEVTSPANYSLSASLRRLFNATVTLKLDPLSVGASPARSAVSTSDPGSNFAPTLVDWTGTLLAGTYRLSIVESGQQVRAGEFSQGSESSFTFAIPTPGAWTACAISGLILARRRRS